MFYSFNRQRCYAVYCAVTVVEVVTLAPLLSIAFTIIVYVLPEMNPELGPVYVWLIVCPGVNGAVKIFVSDKIGVLLPLW